MPENANRKKLAAKLARSKTRAEQTLRNIAVDLMKVAP